MALEAREAQNKRCMSARHSKSSSSSSEALSGKVATTTLPSPARNDYGPVGLSEKKKNPLRCVARKKKTKKNRH